MKHRIYLMLIMTIYILPMNAQIDPTLSGMIISVSSVQVENASELIYVTPSGTVKEPAYPAGHCSNDVKSLLYRIPDFEA